MSDRHSRGRTGLRWMLVLLAVAAVAFAAVSPAAAAGRHASTATQSLTHIVDLTSGHSDFANGIDVLAGSSQWIVVETFHSGQRGVYPGGKSLEAITGDGTVDRLSAPVALQSPSNYKWSLVGDMLTAWVESCCDPTPVYWWNLSANTHGVSNTPSGDDFVLGATPDGWLYELNTSTASGGGQLFEQPANGSAPTPLGDPDSDPGSNLDIDATTTGPDGFVVGYSSGEPTRLWFSGWQSPTFTALDLPSPKDSPSCEAEAFHAVACDQYRKGGISVLRIPTSGAAAISTKTTATTILGVSLTATQTGWVGLVESTAGLRVVPPAPPLHLFTTPAKTAGKVTRSTYPLYSGSSDTFRSHVLTSAFSRFAVAASPADDTRLATTRSASSALTTLLPPSPATVHASAVSLNGRTVAYADDQHQINGGDVFSRSFGRAATARPGKATERLSTSGIGSNLASSPTTVASLTIVGTGAKAHYVTHVVDGHRHTTLHGSPRQYQAAAFAATPYFGVTGHWVLFAHGAKGTAWTLNAATGHSGPATIPASAPAAMTRGRIAFQKRDGSVWSRPITGGKAIRLFRAPKKLIYVNASLIAGGRYVAADYTDDPEDDPVPGPFVRYRHVNGTGPVRTLSVSGVTDANDEGMLLQTFGASYPSETVSTELVHWASRKVDTLLTQTYSYRNSGNDGFDNSGQVSVWGHRVAWIDPRGKVHAATWH